MLVTDILHINSLGLKGCNQLLSDRVGGCHMLSPRRFLLPTECYTYSVMKRQVRAPDAETENPDAAANGEAGRAAVLMDVRMRASIRAAVARCAARLSMVLS